MPRSLGVNTKIAIAFLLGLFLPMGLGAASRMLEVVIVEQGQQGEGGSVTGFRPLWIAGRDSTGNVRSLLMDSSNSLAVTVSAGTATLGSVTVLNGVTDPAGVQLSDGSAATGTAGNPLRVDPTGTTTQPVSDAGGSLTVDNAALAVTGGGAEATALRVTLASDSTGLVSVDDNGGALTVDGTVALAAGTANIGSVQVINADANPVPVSDAGGDLSVDDGGNVISVDDAAGSLTVDNATISVVGGGAEATAQRVTLASDSTGLLSVDDNGGSLTVDGTVSLGAGTATLGSVTVINPDSDPVPVSDAGGALSVDDGGNVISVDDAAGSLTVDNATLSVTGGGAEAAALRVTVASDSTGVLSVDDDGTTLSVDDGAGSLTVDGTVAISAGTATIGSVTVINGDAAPVPVSDAGGALSIDDGGGSLTVDGTVSLGAGTATLGSVTVINPDSDPVPVSDAGGDLSIDDGGNLISVDDGAGSLTIDNATLSVVGGGTEAAAQRVTLASDSTGVLSVDDNGGDLSIDDGGNVISVDDAAGSLTVDNAALGVTGGGVEASALRVTVASDSTGVLSVDDNAGSLTVDGTVDLAAGTASIGSVQVINAATNPVETRVGDGTDTALVTAAGELNVLASAQPGVDIGDVDVLTINGVAPAFDAGTVGATVQRVTLATDDVVTIDGTAGSAVQQGAGAVSAATLRITQSTDDAAAVALADDSIALEAGTSLVGSVVIFDPNLHWLDPAGTVFLIQSAFTSRTTVGADDIEVVAAQGAGESILVLEWTVTMDTALDFGFESDGGGAGENDIWTPVQNAIAWTNDHKGQYMMETDDNENLSLSVSGAADVAVGVRFVVR